jgi:hypothetical protein
VSSPYVGRHRAVPGGARAMGRVVLAGLAYAVAAGLVSVIAHGVPRSRTA